MKYNSRSFLNKSTGLAAIEISVQTTTTYVDANLAISDCNKVVNIDLSSSSKDAFKNKLAKLNKLINELTSLETILKDLQSSPEFTNYFK
jgi:hypothetical protein